MKILQIIKSIKNTILFIFFTPLIVLLVWLFFPVIILVSSLIVVVIIFEFIQQAIKNVRQLTFNEYVAIALAITSFFYILFPKIYIDIATASIGIGYDAQIEVVRQYFIHNFERNIFFIYSFLFLIMVCNKSLKRFFLLSEIYLKAVFVLLPFVFWILPEWFFTTFYQEEIYEALSKIKNRRINYDKSFENPQYSYASYRVWLYHSISILGLASSFWFFKKFIVIKEQENIMLEDKITCMIVTVISIFLYVNIIL